MRFDRSSLIAAAAPFAALFAACEAPPIAVETRPRALVRGPGIPNSDRPASELHRRISPIMGSVSMNQPGVINGTLFLAGNAIHEIWNISDPTAPARMSQLVSPHANGEAESHQISFSLFEDGSLHAVTISGRGIDLWNISDPSAPILESAMELQGIDYGDFTEAVWGVFWQGKYIFAGGTNTGLHIIDATDPTRPALVRRLGSASLGGVSAGPLFALGNLLIVTTPKENAGIVTLDIGAPDDPLLLDAITVAPSSYIGGFFGVHAHLLSPFRSFDVLTDPSNIRLTGSAPTPATEYMSFADSHVFLGSLRVTAGGMTGILEYDLADLDAPAQLAHIRGRDLLSDDQFSIAAGNLLVIADDERGYGGWLAVRNTARDTSGPEVIAVNPPDGAIEQPLSTRIGVSFSDVVELTSAGVTSLELRKEGGAEPLPGRFGVAGTVLSFWPTTPLEPNTRYELTIPAGGITDFVGNAVSTTWRGTFSTRAADANALPCAVAAPTPVAVGVPAMFSAANADETAYSYEWDFADGATASGAAATHAFADPGRRSIAMTVIERLSAASRHDLYEAEAAALGGGVFTRTENAGYSGTGYADFPLITGADTEISWRDVRATRSGSHDLMVRYANGDTGVRRLELFVNGAAVGVLDFSPTGAWTSWADLHLTLTLVGGLNTVELKPARPSAGPNVDRLEVSVARATTCAATQIVHRPIPAGPAPSRSSSVIVAGGRAWIANPDANTVTAAGDFEMDVGGRPRGLGLAPDGTIWVTVDDSIAVLDAADGRVIERLALPPASSPFGIAFAPDGSRAFVALESLGRVVIFDPAQRAQVASVELGAPVRGLAITGDSRRVFVTRFISPADHGEVFELDPARATRVKTIALAESQLADTPDHGRGVPNYLGAIAINPDGTEAWLPSKQDNTQRGEARDGQGLTHDATVRPIMSRIALGTAEETIDRRLDLNDACMPIAVELSPLGDIAFIAIQGSNKIEVRETYNGRIVGAFSVGRAPDGLALSGDRLYVSNFLDRTLTVADVRAFLTGTDNVAAIVETIPLVERELLDPQVLEGKRLFYDASDPRLAKEGYISCAACHLDGREDGRVWDFTDRGEGFRNTITLEGRAGLGQGRVHWTANFDEIQDFENDIRSAFGGTGLMTDEDFAVGTRSDPLGDPKAGVSAELDALAAYVSSLDVVPNSPHRAPDGSLTDDGERGLGLFFARGCFSCHTPPAFTDGLMHDVGTLRATSGKRRNEMLEGIDTPTLLGVFATPPYLHDGSAATLDDVLAEMKHTGVELDVEERRRLVAYMLQIDERERGAKEPEELPVNPPAPPPPSPIDPMMSAEKGCACSTSEAHASPWAVLFIVALAIRKKR